MTAHNSQSVFFVPAPPPTDFPLLEHALHLAAAGFPVIFTHAPIPPGCTCGRADCQAIGKHPVEKRWQKSGTTDAVIIRDRLSRLRFAPNVSIVLGLMGDVYVTAVDVDSEPRMAELLEELGPLPTTVRIDSARGYRLLFTLPPSTPLDRVSNVTGILKKSGVDLKAAGGQIVMPPSMHASGVRYTWHTTGEVAELPAAWVIAIMKPPARPPEAAQYTPQTLREDRRTQVRFEKYLQAATMKQAVIVAQCGQGLRNTTFYLSLCSILPLAHGLSLVGGHQYVLRELSKAALACGLPQSEISRTIASAERWMRESGAVRVPHEVFVNGSQPPPGSPPPPRSAGQPSGGESPIELIQDNGSPAKIAENVARLLALHPLWNGGPRRNLLTLDVHWPKKLPEPLVKIQRKHCEILDEDEVAIQGWLLEQPFDHRVKLALKDIYSAIKNAARRSAYDPLLEFLDSLPPWDGVPRVDTWLTDLAGAVDTPVVRRFARLWLVSAMARALAPGCVADGVLVLIGAQGIGKNYLVSILFGDAPFVLSVGSYRIGHDLEADRMACSSWVIHDDEMSSRRSDADAIKSWVSRREETFRAPYERNLKTHARRAVLICSTNREHFLLDDENRRFWPVQCGHIDITGAQESREQLLAEALHLCRKGESWTLNRKDPLWNEIAELQSSRKQIDPFESDVAKVLHDLNFPDEITVSEICERLDVPPERRTTALAMRIGKAFLGLPYERARVRKGDTRIYAYIKTNS